MHNELFIMDTGSNSLIKRPGFEAHHSPPSHTEVTMSAALRVLPLCAPRTSNLHFSAEIVNVVVLKLWIENPFKKYICSPTRYTMWS